MNIFRKAVKEVEEIEKTMNTFKETSEPEEEWIWVDGYKGTDYNMMCRGYQYEIGKKYDMPDDDAVEECKSGFHLCLMLYHVFDYYSIGLCNRFFKVKALVRKSDKNNYGMYITNGYTSSRRDKLVAKSIIFVSELTIDQVLENTDAAYLPVEYKQLAMQIGVQSACNQYMNNTLVEDGYSETFAAYIVGHNQFNVAHAVGSQKDLSMDMKVLTILLGK